MVSEINDLEAADLLYTDLATENYQVYYNPNHEWYYLSGQDVSELMVFKQADHLMQSSFPGKHSIMFLDLMSTAKTQYRRPSLLVPKSLYSWR